MLELSSSIPMRGDLHITRRCAVTGRVLSVWEKKNTITFDAGTLLTVLLAPNAAYGGSAQLERQIRSMRFGTSNLAPQRTDTSLAAEADVLGVPVRVELVDASRLVSGTGSVEFVAVLDGSSGNGNTYREAGLYTRGTADDPQATTGAVLFARQVFPDHTKTSVDELEFRWRITFTI